MLNEAADKKALHLLDDPFLKKEHQALTTEKLEPALQTSIRSSQGSVSQWQQNNLPKPGLLASRLRSNQDLQEVKVVQHLVGAMQKQTPLPFTPTSGTAR